MRHFTAILDLKTWIHVYVGQESLIMTTSNITRAGAEVHKVNGEDKHELLGVVVALYNKDSRFYCSVMAPDSTFTR